MPDTSDHPHLRERHALRKRARTLRIALVVSAVLVGLAVGVAMAHAQVITPVSPPAIVAAR